MSYDWSDSDSDVNNSIANNIQDKNIQDKNIQDKDIQDKDNNETIDIMENNDDSEYEEERQYIMSLFNKKQITSESDNDDDNTILSKKKRVKKQKHKVSIFDVDNKWKSHRMEEKKQINKKRSFNPRLPIPSKKKYNKNNKDFNIDNIDFPEL